MQYVVLLADDERCVRLTMVAMLRRGDYDLLVAGDGDEALEMSRRYPGRIDLLISDIQMPHLNGIELAGRVLEERPGTRILLIAGNPILLAQQFHFLSKPFNVKVLHQAIAECLAAPPPVISLPERMRAAGV